MLINMFTGILVETKYVIILLAVVVAIAAVIIIVTLSRSSSKKKDMRRKMDDRLREEALDKVLVGGSARRKTSKGAYEVSYDLDQRTKGSQIHPEPEGASLMIMLTERSELSTRKYMLHVTNKITFGSQSSKCDIVVIGLQSNKIQCELFRIGGELFLKNTDPAGRVTLKRGHNQISVGGEAVKLLDHDVFSIGGCVYELTIAHE